ncbi:hypothetical protein [Streptomyces sp. NPDC048436]|uniref:nSTAND3 domain-containing NTPase n=1 Tax=Streptomyces sp. NPDC048436 TaxID=3365550 RepID=UPI0037213BAE
MSEESLPAEAAHGAADVPEPPATESGPAADGTAHSGAHTDGPVSESDALKSLAEGGGQDEAERSEALRAGAIADLIAERLNADASGTRIGTLALFNDSVSFGGGFHTDGRRASAQLGGAVGTVPLEETELAEYTELYVQPEGYDEALDLLRVHHLLLLTGPPGSGRTAAAVNLLAETLALDGAPGGGCHRVLDAATIAAPGWEPPAEHSGYLAVLDDGPTAVSPFGAAGLRSLAGVAARLRAAHCHLVLVGGHDLDMLASDPRADGVVRYPVAAVDPVTVVERRVLGLGGDPGLRSELHVLLKSSGAVAALSERPWASHAVSLASVITADGDLPAAVAALRDPSDQVYTWFRSHQEPEAIAFALAAAVLEDSRYLTVADAAMALYKALAPEGPAPPDIRFRDRLGHEQPWIELVFAKEAGFPGPPRVRFRSSLLRHVVLAYAWTTLDGRREAVLGWLRRLLGHADLEVRAQAAVAAGMLARADHHYAVHRYLKSWAGSTSWPIRQAAATALGVAGGTPESAGQVWDLLQDWAGGGSSAYERRLAGTAANAVGGLFGRNTPERALRVLRTALDRGDDWGTLTPVTWGGLHLLHQGRTGEVLDAYLDWSQPQDVSPMVVKTLSAFVFAASHPYERAAPGTTGADPLKGAVPGVPLLLSRLPKDAARVSELWARALARKPVQEPALDALRLWTDVYADRCPGALDEIAQLLADIARRPGKHRERLIWWLARWSGGRERPSPNSAVLLRAVERAS